MVMFPSRESGSTGVSFPAAKDCLLSLLISFNLVFLRPEVTLVWIIGKIIIYLYHFRVTSPCIQWLVDIKRPNTVGKYFRSSAHQILAGARRNAHARSSERRFCC